MKKIPAIILLAIITHTALGQKIKLKAYDEAPEIAYKTDQFTIWFSVFHVRMAYNMMDTPTQRKYDISGLKEGKRIVVSATESSAVRKLIDDEIGAFLLLGGRADVERKDHSKLSYINCKAGKPLMTAGGLKKTLYTFTDPETGKEIYKGSIVEPRLKNEH